MIHHPMEVCGVSTSIVRSLAPKAFGVRDDTSFYCRARKHQRSSRQCLLTICTISIQLFFESTTILDRVGTDWRMCSRLSPAISFCSGWPNAALPIYPPNELETLSRAAHFSVSSSAVGSVTFFSTNRKCCASHYRSCGCGKAECRATAGCLGSCSLPFTFLIGTKSRG